MKKAFLLLLLIAPLFVGCSSDDLENLTTVSEEIELTETFEVRIQDGQSLIYSTSKTFDASQDDAFARFGNKIDEVIVQSVTYTILDNANFSNPNEASIVDATFAFEKNDGTSIDVASITNQPIAPLLGITSSLPFNSTALNIIATEFKNTGIVTLEPSVELDNAVSFDLEITINMDVSGSIVN